MPQGLYITYFPHSVFDEGINFFTILLDPCYFLLMSKSVCGCVCDSEAISAGVVSEKGVRRCCNSTLVHLPLHAKRGNKFRVRDLLHFTAALPPLPVVIHHFHPHHYYLLIRLSSVGNCFHMPLSISPPFPTLYPISTS